MWSSLANLTECRAKLTPTSSNTFITIKETAILEYNIADDRFTEIILFRDHFIPVHKASEYMYAFNHAQQMLYLLNENEANAVSNTQERRFIKCDLKNNKCYILSTLQDYRGHYSNCILLNDALHLIGGVYNNKHLCWNEKSNEFQQIHEFKEFANGYFMSHDIAHIKSKKILLLFSGVELNSVMENSIVDIIYKYDIVKQKWSTLDAKMPFLRNTFGVTSVFNDECVLLFGGYGANGHSDDIWIYCVSTQTFRKTVVKCPQSGIFKACTITDKTRNELLAFGFVRNIKKDQFTPFYLMKLMQSYFWRGTTFLIEENTGLHWKIDTLKLFHEPLLNT